MILLDRKFIGLYFLHSEVELMDETVANVEDLPVVDTSSSLLHSFVSEFIL